MSPPGGQGPGSIVAAVSLKREVDPMRSTPTMTGFSVTQALRYSFFVVSPSSHTRALAIVLSAIMLALSGCSAMRLAYSYADNYFAGIVQDYFDPTPEQMRAVRAKAEQLLAWHRQDELPLYVAMFDQAAQKARDGLTEEEVRWGLTQLRARYDSLAQRIVELNAPLLTELSAQNLAALEGKFAAENAKLESGYLEADQTSRDERRVKRVQNQFERWVGPLSVKQRAIVTAWVADAPSAPINWYEERVTRQQRMLTSLRSERNPALLAVQITALWLGRGPTTERRARNESRVTALILSLDQTLSAAQRERAVVRMQRYADDFRSLSP
jgi:hypothetical protein